MKNKRSALIYKICIFIYIVTLMICFYYHYQNHNNYALNMGIVALFTPFLMPLAFYLLKWKMSDYIKIANIVFVYFASVIGSCAYGYSIPYFDKVVHFFSGLIASTIGIVIFQQIKHMKKINNKEDYYIFLIFINAINLSVAVLWEFYEYFMLVFFNNDCINHFKTGVHDSLTDMICAFAAGLFITYSVIRYYKTNHKGFFIQIADDIYDQNQ